MDKQEYIKARIDETVAIEKESILDYLFDSPERDYEPVSLALINERDEAGYKALNKKAEDEDSIFFNSREEDHVYATDYVEEIQEFFKHL